MKIAVFWDVNANVVLLKTKVSEERIASTIRVTGIGKLGTTLRVTSNGSTLRNVGSYDSHTASHPRKAALFKPYYVSCRHHNDCSW
jgi:hypothetical protein